jgi:hypothetical protein
VAAGRIVTVSALLLIVGSLALSACGGRSDESQMPTTGNYAPIKPSPILQANENGIDPGVLSRSGSDMLTVIQRIGQYKANRINHYRLVVTNTSSIGSVNTFNWHPPRGMTVIDVTGSSTGRCWLGNGRIVCQALLRPPTCTCRGDGGKMTIDFTAQIRPNGTGNQPGFVGASLNVLTQTPVPYVIPSSPNEKPGENSDAAVCKKGQRTTPGKPCAPSG